MTENKPAASVADPAPQVLLQIHESLATESLPDSDFLQHWCAVTLTAVAAAGYDYPAASVTVEISVLMTSCDAVQQLNKDYRQRDAATNVLSFPSHMPADLSAPVSAPMSGHMSTPDSGIDFIPLGDLVFCPPIIVQEASAQHKSAADHWAHLVVHGVLHLCGLDHLNDKDADTMERLEIQILSGSGVANPYLATNESHGAVHSSQ